MSLVAALAQYAASGGRSTSPLLGALKQERQARAAAVSRPRPIDDGEGGGAGGPSSVAQITPAMIPRGAGRIQGAAVRAASTQLGDPYHFGASSAGANPSSFDCSSLVQWAYRQAGVNIPRDTVGQMKALPAKSWSDLQVGDPIYRRSGGHVVLYAGNGRVLAAPHTGTVVQYQPLSNFPPSEYQPYAAVTRKR